MSTNVIPFTQAQMPAHLRGAALPDMNAAAQAGVAESMAVVSFRGKNWRFNFRGEEKLHVDHRGAPDPFFDVVIVGVAEPVAKIYYAKKYTEGDDSPPDCWSSNGVTPDSAATNKQAAACAQCPHAEWGSRITESGSKAKACSDSKRLAVVPYADVENAAYGGPMMLRLPATTLQSFSQYCRQLAQFGAQPAQVVTRLSFDPAPAYPKITFQPVGWIQEPEVFERAKEWAISDQVNRILKMDDTHADAAQPQTMVQAAKALAQKPAHLQQIPAPQPTTVAQPAATVVAQQPVDELAALRAKVAEMEAAKDAQNDVIPIRVTVPAESLTQMPGAPIPVNPPAAQVQTQAEPVLTGEVLAPQPGTVEQAPDDMEAEINRMLGL